MASRDISREYQEPGLGPIRRLASMNLFICLFHFLVSFQRHKKIDDYSVKGLLLACFVLQNKTAPKNHPTSSGNHKVTFSPIVP
jgi:hypothetical protein